VARRRFEQFAFRVFVGISLPELPPLGKLLVVPPNWRRPNAVWAESNKTNTPLLAAWINPLDPVNAIPLVEATPGEVNRRPADTSTAAAMEVPT
jgi:hypothetical protein